MFRKKERKINKNIKFMGQMRTVVHVRNTLHTYMWCSNIILYGPTIHFECHRNEEKQNK